MAILKLASRNLLRNRRRTAVTLAAMIIGVGVMVALRGFINGQQVVILENMIDGRLGSVQVPASRAPARAASAARWAPGT